LNQVKAVQTDDEIFLGELGSSVYDLVKSNKIEAGFYSARKEEDDVGAEGSMKNVPLVLEVNSTSVRIENFTYKVCFIKNITS